MRVGLKLTLAILGLLVAVLAIEGVLRLQSAREVFESDLEHEQRLLGRALAPSLELAWRTEGLEAALDILRRAQEGESEVRMRLVSMEPHAPGVRLDLPSVGAGHQRMAPLVLKGKETTFIDRSAPFGIVYTYIPILGPHKESSAIELSKSLMETEKRLKHSLVRVLLTALTIALGAGVLAVTVGDRMMGKPLRRLAARAARIAAGDLSPPLVSNSNDEIGQLNRAIARMVEGLAAARAQVLEETEARVQAERRARQGERLATVGTLAAGVAHELGTPLQVISGRARMIEQASSANDPRQKNAHLIREQAGRMERIVRSLLHLAHPTRINGTEVELPSLIRETVAIFEPEAEPHGVRFELGELAQVTVHGDKDHLAQVLSNLFKNAVQAMPNGGIIRVDLSLPKQLKPPTGEKAHSSGYTCLQVADNGLGIAQENQSKIFDPFFTTKDVGQGTGLGLSLAYGMAREHGGWIEVESGPASGTLFRVWLPAGKKTSR